MNFKDEILSMNPRYQDTMVLDTTIPEQFLRSNYFNYWNTDLEMLIKVDDKIYFPWDYLETEFYSRLDHKISINIKDRRDDSFLFTINYNVYDSIGGIFKYTYKMVVNRKSKRVERWLNGHKKIINPPYTNTEHLNLSSLMNDDVLLYVYKLIMINNKGLIKNKNISAAINNISDIEWLKNDIT